MNLRGVYVINLPERQDRLESFTQGFRGHSDLDFQVAPGVRHGNANIGCLLAHLAVLDTADGPALIFEDDAVFSDHFTLDLNPPPDWEILWLGGQHAAKPLWVDDVWERPVKIMRTHAYVVRQPHRVAQHLRASGAMRLDPIIGQLPIPQYSLRVFTVGQGAGQSDITGLNRTVDQFWNVLD